MNKDIEIIILKEIHISKGMCKNLSGVLCIVNSCRWISPLDCPLFIPNKGVCNYSPTIKLHKVKEIILKNNLDVLDLIL